MIDSISPSRPAGQDNGRADSGYAAARRAMVNSQLRTSDVNTPAIMRIMDSVPRENFVPETKRASAYIDRAIAIGPDRMLNPPVTHGLMLERAALKADDTVLIIGAGTGYLAALAAPQVAQLVALEEDAALFAALKDNMTDTANVRAEHGALASGYASGGPYSVIIIDGAVEDMPPVIAGQLAENGRIICGIWDNGVARLAEGRSSGGKSISLNSYVDADVAQLSAFAKPAEYRFS